MNAAAEVKNIDVLNYTNPLFRRLYGKAYLDMVNAMPEVLGWMYDTLDKPWENERRRLALDRLNAQPLINLLKKNDLILRSLFYLKSIVFLALIQATWCPPQRQGISPAFSRARHREGL